MVEGDEHASQVTRGSIINEGDVIIKENGGKTAEGH